MSFLSKTAHSWVEARIPYTLARESDQNGLDTYRPQNVDEVKLPNRVCGADECASGWMVPWKNRRRPIFEENWGCGRSCLEKMVKTAVRRERGESGHLSVDPPHRHRIPLGLILLAQGWITHPQLQAALEAQKAGGQGRIGDWLKQSCGLDEGRITRALSMQWNCSVLAVEGFTPASMALVMPKRFVAEFGFVPLRVAGSRLLYLAFEDRMNAAAAFGVGQMSGLRVESGLLNTSAFAEAKSRLLASDSVPATMRMVSDADALSDQIQKLLEQAQPVASRLVRVHQYYWLRTWLESGAKSRFGSLPSSTEDMHDYLFTIGNRSDA